MQKPIRILHVTATMDMGGIENFLINIYRIIDRNKVQFDFVINDRKKEDIFEKEIKELGGKIYKIPSIVEGGHFQYFKSLRKILKENNYMIVHSHYNMVSGFILREAKKCDVKIRIAHSHNTNDQNLKKFNLINAYKRVSKFLINKNATLKFACSKEAGEWLYSKNRFEIIKNGIVTKNYIFNENIRKLKREELKIEKEEIVLGHIGRFDLQKNHEFIIKIFNELVKLNLKYKLILVGDGKLKKEVEKKVRELKLEEKVIFLGVRKDVNELLQAMDLFLFPSLYEGLPVTMVEVQSSGLKSFISNTISQEVDLNCGLINWLSLDQTAKEWAELINNTKAYKRRNTINEIKKAGYDIEENIKKIEKVYLSFNKE